MTRTLTAKDAWSSTAIDQLEKMNISEQEFEKRTEMIHKLNLIDESLNVYNIRLENAITLGDKLVEKILNTRKKREKSNTNINTLANADDLVLETRKRVFYDDNLKKWNGKGDTILRNITCNYEGKIIFECKLDQSTKMVYRNIEMSEAFSEKMKNINLKELHISPSLVGSQTGSVFEDEFADEDLVVEVNDDHFMDNFADHFNEYEVDDQVPDVHEEIQFDQLEPTPFSYHKAWSGPSSWKISSARKKNRKQNPNKKRKSDFFEFYLKDVVFADKRNTIFKEEEILDRRKRSQTLKKDFGIRLEDLYTFTLMTSIDCFIEKKEKIADVSVQHSYNDVNISINNSIPEINETINLDHHKENIQGENTSENIIMNDFQMFKHPKSQKRYTMRDLQAKIQIIIDEWKKEKQQITLKEIYEILNEENTEMNTSWQYMVVALLEMANRGLKIENVNDQIVIYC